MRQSVWDLGANTIAAVWNGRGRGNDDEGDGKFEASDHRPPVQGNQSLGTVSCQAGNDISALFGGALDSQHWDWAVKLEAPEATSGLIGDYMNIRPDTW